MKKIILGISILALVSACAPVVQLQDYTPTVDTYTVDNVKYQKDLVECKSIASQKEIEYKKQMNNQMAANIVSSIIVGAIVGNVAGNSYGSNKSGFINAGIAAGAASGINESSDEIELATYGPKRIVDRCLISRGHPIIGDLGRG